MADSRQKSQLELSSPEAVTAPSKVFEIRELLETVLAHLPARDLLMCECINKTWHAVIKDSRTLQGKLFFDCDPITLSKDMNESILEINPFFLLVQRRWSFAVYREGAANGFKGSQKLDYPEASWKKMYLSRPAVCKIALQRKHSSGENLLQQVIQHDTTKMYHLGDSRPRWPVYERFSQSGGIRMHHLLGMDPSLVFFLTLTGDKFTTVANCYGDEWPKDCPRASLRQFQDMYVYRKGGQGSSDNIPPELNVTALY